MRISLAVVAAAVVFIAVANHTNAAEIQTLSAQIDGAAFVSDNQSILLVPVQNSMSLIASTAGASSYPPPKTRVDETGTTLSIDQRGAPRVFGPRCDIGAVEFGAVVDRIFKNGFQSSAAYSR